MKLLFRCDASITLGAGHLMRCLSIADLAASRGHECHFVCAEQPGFDATQVIARQHGLTRLPSQPDWRSLYRAIMPWAGSDWLIVDHYQLDRRWEIPLAALFPQQLVVDDLANRAHRATQLLDVTPSRQLADYQHSDFERRPLLGPSYAPLRPEFAALRSAALAKRRLCAPIKRLLLSLGAMDSDNHLSRILPLIDKLSVPQLEIDLVLASHAPHIDALSTLIAASRHRVTLHLDAHNMAELMLQADLAIGAGGTSSWERAALALPTLLFTLADNQQENAEQLAKANAVIWLGDLRTLNEQQLLHQLFTHWPTPAKLQQLSQHAATLCDGAGTQRLLETLTPLQHGYWLQPVTTEDAEWMCLWQQHTVTRQHSRNPAPPSLNEHQVWLDSTLQHTHRWLFKLMSVNGPCAVVRLDESHEAPGNNEVSLYVDPQQHQQGHGKRALALLHKLFPWLTFHAYIHPENQGSLALFQSVGYQPSHQQHWFYFTPREPFHASVYY
ncbi:UDP-2,4-diacetamido-2,4,6-trideoxy-beta-L-altropyranose hydrolase [Aeromonas cavernicola]|uniref:UDP-2,4-diacetamido-2,4, 6-trideoxy-beta-L-altropyranose hydrolase n=1 Tax=Aeromonas cavernicola TaxID=1006623 RepID=A0A2H9U5M3_9GAMM|nr:UDP-2,4-diacetamido-2,4,6-trideoxy-beta-L-altropyranose hydrolase [Aeromonas cavernicola]PJG59345.1 UDP-2,4-diacetamido-2,4,6-trideoxy-beta-L-altropyranose hydrolase [Aeromonas cavernicola]